MSMLERQLENQKLKTVSGNIPVTNLYTAGIAGEAFLRCLKDREEIIGSFCPKCKKAFVPARLFCERCLSRLESNQVAAHEGTLQTFTKVHIDLDGKPLEKPEWVGFITFKGFEGGLIHRLHLNGFDEKKLKVGAKVKAIFEPPQKRKGSILDISHFQLIY